ncbi:GLPGLI family protein [Parafilimonas sp.]|uniref:GLPGLI family protein n=1 Tax=Parafilimonas sp. TaxID=1969739 RepID=UPI003F7FADF3
MMNTYKSGILFILTIISNVCVKGQNIALLREGRIEFEKKVNMYSYVDANDQNIYGQSIEQYKQNNPQFKSILFDLYFKDNETLYKRSLKNTQSGNSLIWKYFDSDNSIYLNFKDGIRISQRKIFEQIFVIQDTIENIKWKITEETREIAGFHCRRANAIIMDSLYIVAFYTNAINCSGGPESINGLPGMILGLAVPSLHFTIFAKKIFSDLNNNSDIAPPLIGKKVTQESFQKALHPLLQDYQKNENKIEQLIMF